MPYDKILYIILSLNKIAKKNLVLFYALHSYDYEVYYAFYDIYVYKLEKFSAEFLLLFILNKKFIFEFI